MPAGGPDALYRVHIKEELGLTGKLVCKDSHFVGGGQILSAGPEDLWETNTLYCNNLPVADWNPPGRHRRPARET